MTYILVGLGNPGKEYLHTLHNVGFAALDALWDYLERAHYSPTPWKLDKKSNALVSTSTVEDHHVLMAKPQTFMNNSGSAVRALLNRSHGTTHLIVLHDDIDLMQGVVRIRHNGSSAGHKGMQSVMDALGHTHIVRIRIGIRPTLEFSGDTTAFVLKKMSPPRQKTFHALFEHTASFMTDMVRFGPCETTITLKSMI
jgi:PTH1 family peptidyl-tRNA hydrolase